MPNARPSKPSSEPPRPHPSNRPEETLPRGASLGRYVVVDVVGHGGMGVVYAAYDTQLDRKLAIKLLRRDVSNSDDAAEVQSRMFREAQAMARLTHPNVVAVFDVGTFDERVFLAMEFVDGWTLKEWLKTPRPWRERLAVLKAAGRGLAAAHAVGLVHRDFKPDNVLVGKDGRVLVTDFGLARMASPDEPASGPEASGRRPRVIADLPIEATSHSISRSPLDAPLTLTGSVLGTVGYMPLEQAFGEVTNAWTDQFSYCATAYVALYGERPFPGDDLHSYVTAVGRPLREPPKGAEIPAWVHRALARGLSQEPKDRFPSMEALLHALSDDPAIRRRRWATGAAAAVALGLAIWGGVRGGARAGGECVVDTNELEGVWGDEMKPELRASFTAAAGADGAETAARVEKVLDGAAAKWLSMRGEVCTAARVHHQQTDDVRRMRDECLDRRRTEMRALTTMFRQADAQVVKRALDASYGLTSVTFCADVQGLKASAGLPDDPAARSHVLEARGLLARAGSLSATGKYDDALRLAESAATIARESRHDSTLAESLLIVGDVKKNLGDFVGAEPPLTEATWTAMAAGTDAITARAAGLAAFVVGAKLRRTSEAHVWLGLAESAIKRMGGSEEIEAEVANDKAGVLAEGDWQPEQALEIGDRVVRTYQRIFGTHPKTARAIYSHGVDYSYLGDHAKACSYFETSLAMSEQIGGPTYTEVGRASYVLGDCLSAQGEFTRGEQSLERALGVFDRTAAPYWSAITLQSLVRAKLMQGDIPAALAAGRRARDYMAKVSSTAVLVPIVDVPTADALMASGDVAEALGLCDEALAIEEQTGQLEPQKVLGWDALRCRGDALVRSGHPKDAIPLLERSLTLPRRIYPGDLARTRFALARALTAVGTDRARAVGLATDARKELATYSFLTVELAEVDRWLAKPAK
jgi:tetratricopeptide (TPR) repeat protein